MESSQVEFSLEAKRITKEDFEFVAGNASESHANSFAADEQRSDLRRGTISEESIDDKTMVQREKVTARTHENTSNESSCETGKDEEEEKEDRVMKELRKVQRQNMVTQCLVSALMVLTLTWQVSEVSLILKLKDGLNHPLRSFGGFVSWVLRRRLKAPHQGEDEEEKEEERKQKRQGDEAPQASPFPAIKIPKLSLPSLDFITEE
ncbi:unnamed protein product [Cuscuta campestris]|uniref:Uncharacterized protein n=1 Tax=Cuscuta campestris TaxID=132261 RepID=A0A484KKT8_9ASTE|nr:unnamed protein product [Cuscuta campestris]